MTDERLSAVFGSVERRGAWTVPSTLHVRALFGSAELDLREAVFGPGTTTIEVSIAFGSLELTVPPGMQVEVNVSSIAGSVEDGRRSLPDRVLAADGGPYRSEVVDPPRVRLVGTTKFGSCQILQLERGQTRRDLYRALRQTRLREHFAHVHDALHHAHEARSAAADVRDRRHAERHERQMEGRIEAQMQRRREHISGAHRPAGDGAVLWSPWGPTSSSAPGRNRCRSRRWCRQSRG